MKKFILLISLLCLSCTLNLEKANQILAAEGCTEIEYGGRSFWGCGQDDTRNIEFQCTKNGTRITGIICGGNLKGYTVRYK